MTPFLNPFNLSGFNNTVTTGLLPNPTNVLPIGQSQATLNLNQIEGFTPIHDFIDETNTKWQLVKSSMDSTVDIPDPKAIQVLDYWNHEFPGIKTKLYVYVVEGIRSPRVETELPTRVLYQWFSTVCVPTFTPQMITEKEWLKANVYAAPVINARISKLKAICHVTDSATVTTPKQDDKLLKIDELLDGSNTK